jgi:hypothetical protein
MTATTDPEILPGRCRCHHYGRTGTALRYMCTGSITLVRPSDGRRVCAGCTDCDPASSKGFGR